ncbi:hypothetical protein ACFQY0_09415 [Haloferula chungangensis]|uniref:Uncharacterized protein n=1 Tax=Haloferula chungangensis TaxID=1048331 RepID=A0ABW2L4U7_9BACT
MKIFLILVFAMSSLAHATFVPPADGPVPFRRDKLPVDTDTMESLSKQLVVLAGASDLADPTQARRAAQILGLALALNPTSQAGLHLAERLKQGQPADAVGSDEMNQATSRAWHLMGWLEQPEAGSDGNALAACLADILTKVDPQHPRALELAGKGEQGKWQGWIAAVDAFKNEAPPVASTNETPEPPSNNDPAVPLKLPSATVQIPLWYTDKTSSKLMLRPVAVQMSARIEGADSNVKVKLEGLPPGELETKVSAKLKEFLTTRYGTLPKGLMYHFKMAEAIPYGVARNGNAILGAVLVLADASLSGKAPTGMVLAEPDSDGKLKLPAKFWQTIRVLADYEPGTRLVVPAAAKDFMSPLITLDKSSFFINFEVLMADDAASLCDFASSDPPKDVQESHDDFETIRQARGTRSLGSFLSHDSTQQRLKQVISIFPNHVSARMLALRGTSQWPKRLPREIFAREIRASIEPLRAELQVNNWAEIKTESLQNKVDACREELATVEKLFGSVGDRQELHAPAMNVTKLISSAASDAKRSTDDYTQRLKVEAGFKAAWAEYVSVLQLLTFAAGDSEEYPLPVIKAAQ